MTEEQNGWTPDEVVELLGQVELFTALALEDLRKIGAVVEQVDVDDGAVLFRQGDAADAFWVVARGAVRIVRSDGHGRDEVLGVREQGEGFGEMGLVVDAPRSASARAEGAARLLRVPREDFQWLMGGDSLSYRVLKGLGTALRAAEVRFASVEAVDEVGALRHAWTSDVSRAMQAKLMPRAAPRVPGYDVAAGTTLEESGEGGAVWDFIALGSGRTAFLTLDVRQPGFPRAHQLGVARAVFRALASEDATVKQILVGANEAMSAAAVDGVGQFVEVGVLVLTDGGLEWASAGRVPAGVIRRDGSFTELGAHGPPLGMMGGFQYDVEELSMSAGDTAFVLSHGSKGLFRGAADLIAELHGKPAGDVVASVHAAVRKALGEERTETSVVFARKH